MTPSQLRRLRNRLQPPLNGPGASWREILGKDAERWERARSAATGGRVLMATSLGGYEHGTVLESVLTAALTLRGAQVDVLLCDEFLPACQLTKFAKLSPEELVKRGPGRLCKPCFRSGEASYRALGCPVLRYSDHVDDKRRLEAASLSTSILLAEIPTWRYEGLAVGEHAMAGALRFYGRGDIDREPQGEQVVRRYLEAALLTTFAMRTLLETRAYDVAVFHHGIYVPQGLIGEVCREAGVRVVNSNPAYREKTFIFSHGDSYHHTMISEPVEAWQNMSWGPTLEKTTMSYLASRRHGSDDWIRFNEEPEEDLSEIKQQTGARFDRPTIALLTNVLWDAQLHYPSNAFPDMLAWVQHTINWFAQHPELDLIIRIHPAEVTGAVPSRQPLLLELDRAFPQLPDNVIVVPPESKVSTYTLLDQCDSALIYNTKTGIELASAGIPVVVAGEAWIRGKGFSCDATNVEEYDDILSKLPFGVRLQGATLELARRYAFHFFFRRMIPLPFVHSPSPFRLSLDLDNLSPLIEGATSGLDVMCNGILDGLPFVYPSEKMLLAEA